MKHTEAKNYVSFTRKGEAIRNLDKYLACCFKDTQRNERNQKQKTRGNQENK